MKINSDRIIARLQINNILERKDINPVNSLSVLARSARLKYIRSKMNRASMHDNWIEYRYWENEIKKNYAELNSIHAQIYNNKDNIINIKNTE